MVNKNISFFNEQENEILIAIREFFHELIHGKTHIDYIFNNILYLIGKNNLQSTLGLFSFLLETLPENDLRTLLSYTVKDEFNIKSILSFLVVECNKNVDVATNEQDNKNFDFLTKFKQMHPALLKEFFDEEKLFCGKIGTEIMNFMNHYDDARNRDIFLIEKLAFFFKQGEEYCIHKQYIV